MVKTKIISFVCSGYTVRFFFFENYKGHFNIKGMITSANTGRTMTHGRHFRIMTQQPFSYPSRGYSLSASYGESVMGNSDDGAMHIWTNTVKVLEFISRCFYTYKLDIIYFHDFREALYYLLIELSQV